MEKDLQSLRKIIEYAIEQYHKYRSETFAILISLDRHGFRIMFSGSFCDACGISDDYQLLQYFMDEKGLKVNVARVSEYEDGFTVDFRIVS